MLRKETTYGLFAFAGVLLLSALCVPPLATEEMTHSEMGMFVVMMASSATFLAGLCALLVLAFVDRLTDAIWLGFAKRLLATFTVSGLAMLAAALLVWRLVARH